MKYINGYDLPEHIQSTLKGVINGQQAASITCRHGQAVIISADEYENLKALRSDRPYEWTGLRLDRELDGILREEIDF